MERRTLSFYRGDGEPKEHTGPYLESYDGKDRIGIVYDPVKGRAVVFRQAVESRDDYRPTDFLCERDPREPSGESWTVWSDENPTEKNAFPSDYAPCRILDWTIRELTTGEREYFQSVQAAILRGPKKRPADVEKKASAGKDPKKVKAAKSKRQIKTDKQEAFVRKEYESALASGLKRGGALEVTVEKVNANREKLGIEKQVTSSGVRRVIEKR